MRQRRYRMSTSACASSHTIVSIDTTHLDKFFSLPDHFRLVLTQMCKHCNVNVYDVKWADNEWYSNHHSTEQQEQQFKQWLADFLYNNRAAQRELLANSYSAANKKTCERFADEFWFTYGFSQKAAEQPITYPCLMYYSDPSSPNTAREAPIMVLFTAERTGTVVYASQPCSSVGKTLNHWHMSYFKPLQCFHDIDESTQLRVLKTMYANDLPLTALRRYMQEENDRADTHQF